MGVIVTWFHGEEKWERVKQGLEDNLEDITEIVISCDHEEEIDPMVVRWGEKVGIPLRVIYQPHNGFGVCKALNRGVWVCRAEKILHIDDDVVVPGGMIELYESILEPRTLLVPLVQDIGNPTDQIPGPVDVRLNPALIMRGACQGFYREDFVEVGGWNEQMVDYGFQDYEFGLKWMTEFGPGSIRIVGEVQHIPGLLRPKPDPDSLSVKEFRRALADYWGVSEENVIVDMHKRA